MKTMQVISEAVRDTKHPFRKADNQPKKSLKNRYEHRKIKEYLNLGDWLSEDAI
jgi:hypothetical protein